MLSSPAFIVFAGVGVAAATGGPRPPHASTLASDHLYPIRCQVLGCAEVANRIQYLTLLVAGNRLCLFLGGSQQHLFQSLNAIDELRGTISQSSQTATLALV